jgi:hypothetical protein
MSNATISEAILNALGYKEWQKNDFQKRIEDDIGIRYHINVNRTDIPFDGRRMNVWSFNVQFSASHGAIDVELTQWFNDDGRYSGNTVADAEDQFDRIWESLGKPYYERK